MHHHIYDDDRSLPIIEFMSTCGHNDFKINGTKRFKYVEANRTL